MDKLLAAIDANFEGYDDVRALLRSAPCYGNNDEYADAIGREIDKISVEYGNKYSMNDLGIHNDVRYVPFTSHVPFGKVVSATPNGRTDSFPPVRRFLGLARRGRQRPHGGAAFQLHHQEYGSARPRRPYAEHQVHAQVRGRRAGHGKARSPSSAPSAT
jgi:Pyruvate-formate lyase